MKPKDPMSLRDLPQQLKAHQQSGEYGDCGVVGMGSIEEPKKRSYGWLAYVALFSVCLTSAFTYDAMSTKQHTVVLDVQDNANTNQMLTQIVSDSGGKILTVTKKDDSIYEVKVATKKSKSSFLEWLRKDKNVKKATEIDQ
jgi:hypothetical protein